MESTSTATATATTTRLCPGDEANNIKRLKENLQRQAYRDWPNEAGFQGLTEHRDPINLKVKGTIPAWAAGSLYRTGPGDCKVENTKDGTFHISHFFDGLAHTHKFEILAATNNEQSNGGDASDQAVARVEYSSRYQSDEIVKDIRATGKLRALTFAQRSDPCVGIFSKFMTEFRPPEILANINVTVYANMTPFQKITSQKRNSGHKACPGNVFLATDTAWFCEIEPRTLAPLGIVKQQRLHPDLKGPGGPAHGLQDPQTGDYFSFNVDYGLQATYRIFQVSAKTGRTTILATVYSKAAYIHSFFLSKNYIILCIPVAHYEHGGLQILLKGNALDAIQPFDESETCRWFIIDRYGEGVVGEFISPAAFFFHTTNAFEDENGDLICEMVQYPNTFIIYGLYYDILLNRDNKANEYWVDAQRAADSHPRLIRYRFPRDNFGTKYHCMSQSENLPSPQLHLDIPPPHAGDMPTINPAYRCRKHRFVYGLTNRGLSTLFDAIVKVDTQTREVLMWAGPQGHSPGEAIFIPRPAKGDTDEDDGILLSVVLDGENRKSYLLCLDARDMRELGRAECDFAVGFGLHGQHIKTG